MLHRKPYEGPTKLVVAFDIGTTYSGVSYCILEPRQIPEVLVVNRYPGQGLVRGDAKVPSLLYYDKNGNVKASGAEVLAESVSETALREGWAKAEWWKLHLRPKHLASSINTDNDLPPLPPRKSALDILTDFTKYLFDCVKDYIVKHHPAFNFLSVEDTITYIFTHPNGWEGFQQQLYRQAIARAGLIPDTPEGQCRVHLLSEGEASLHFCVPNLLRIETDNSAAPQGVVIIDAGGGTIDLSMFSMTCNPISCKEIAPAECRLQGSVYVTRRAEALIRRKLDGWDHSSPEDIAEYTREFDRSAKLTIESDKVPAYIKVSGGHRYNNQKYDIVRGSLRLTGEEAVGLFTESLNSIISAFERQLAYANVPITTAFFVGGLSTNDWIWSQLQAYFAAKNIQVSRPDNHINKAVANGAVLSYVDRDNHLVSSRMARATYGVICGVEVDENDEEHIQRKDKWEKDADGGFYVPGYFEWKIRKGQQIPEQMELRETFSHSGKSSADFGLQNVRLMCYRGSSDDPRWMDRDPSSFLPLCTVNVDLSATIEDLIMQKTPSGEFYEIDYDVIVFYGFTELRAELTWKSKDGVERRVPATVVHHG